MEVWGIPLVVGIAIYVAICFGRIAAKHGKNPILFGVLSLISPINLMILGIWAFHGDGGRPLAR